MGISTGNSKSEGKMEGRYKVSGGRPDGSFERRVPTDILAILRKAKELDQAQVVDFGDSRPRVVVWRNGHWKITETVGRFSQSLPEAAEQVVGRLLHARGCCPGGVVADECSNSFFAEGVGGPVPVPRTNKKWYSSWYPSSQGDRDEQLHDRRMLSKIRRLRTIEAPVQADPIFIDLRSACELSDSTGDVDSVSRCDKQLR